MVIAMQAEVRSLELSATALRALDPHRRYVFALVGHVFNELMLLQKWVHISRKPPGNPGPEEDAAVGVTMFLVRLLSAKVYEALHEDALTKKSVAEVLRADYFSGDTYFHWAEMTAALPAMKHVNPDDPFKGLDQMVSELGVLLSGVTDCLARGLQAFLKKSNVDAKLSEPIRFDAPPLNPLGLHFFFADERLGQS